MCQDPQTVARRHYVVTPYEPDGDKLVPYTPDTCPLGAKEGTPCRVFPDHVRPRKTGPRFGLYVMRCRAHGIGFTLYPPGFTPWGRKAWGSAKSVSDPQDPVERFRNTYFDAALDAAAGVPWQREKVLPSDCLRPSDLTQACYLSRSIRLLGVNQEPSLRGVIAQLLSIPGQTLHDAAGIFEQQADLKGLGRAVCTVLEAIPSALTRVFEPLAILGAAVGLWPPLHVWHPQRRQLLPREFPWVRTRAAVIPP